MWYGKNTCRIVKIYSYSHPILLPPQLEPVGTEQWNGSLLVLKQQMQQIKT